MNESIEELLASGAVVPDRPGSKRLVPAAQSVVVPVGVLNEAAGVLDCEGYGPLSMSLLSCLSAPALSSLEVGEVERPLGAAENGAAFLDRIEHNYDFSCEGGELKNCAEWHEARRCFEVLADFARHAALSPEAPAREGVKYTIRQEYGFGITEHDPALTPRHEAQASDLTDIEAIAIEIADTVASPGLNWSVDDHCRSELHAHTVSSVVSILEGRHEAPAEGAGEELLSAIDAFMPSAEVAFLWSKETPPADEVQRYRERYWAVKDALLRARSSAPEAREEALGNLLAVIHGDGGHRALEVGTKQAALEAEKIVAGLFAAPNADKLRIAVEAMQGAIEWDKRTGYRMPYRVRDPLYAALDLSTPDALKGDAK